MTACACACSVHDCASTLQGSAARGPFAEAPPQATPAAGAAAGHALPHLHSTVFDAYSQGFCFPRCEDAITLAPVRHGGTRRDSSGAAAAGNTLDGPVLPEVLHGRRGAPAVSSRGACGGGAAGGRRHRRWFTDIDADIPELHLPELRSGVSASGALGALRSQSGAGEDLGRAAAARIDTLLNLGHESSSAGSELEQERVVDEEAERWDLRLQSVRQRLQHLRQSQHAEDEQARERAAPRRPGEPQLGTPARVAVLGSPADEQTSTGARAQGRRPRGPGDAFQGMSLDQVLRSRQVLEEPAQELGGAADSGDAEVEGEGGERASGGELGAARGRRAEAAAAAQGLADAFGGLSLGQLLPPRAEERGPNRGTPTAGSPVQAAARFGRRRMEERGGAQGVGGGRGGGRGRRGDSGAFWVDVTEDATPEPPPLARTRHGTIVRGGRRQVLGAGSRGQMGLPQRAPDLARLMRQRGRGGSPGAREGGGSGAEALRLLERFAFSPKAFKAMAAKTGRARQDSMCSDDYECAVCLSAFAPNQVLRRYSGCGHCFHERCITEWLVRGDARCPMCRWCPFKQSW